MAFCAQLTGHLATPSRVQRQAGVRCSAVAQSRGEHERCSRRNAALLFASVPLLMTSAAFAKDPEEAKKAKEARMSALRNAAADMKQTGKGEAAFQDSDYAVSDDKSPNVHTRQEEGLRQGK